MIRGIDHLVIAVRDPDAAAAELTDRLGLAFTGGGHHPGAGTFNRLAFLGEPYLELIGVDDAEAAAGRAIGAATLRALEAGGGLATFALVDDALETSVAELAANGSSIGPVVRGSRQRPDGEPVEWWTAAFERLGLDRPPFLIRHANVGAEWGAAALEERRGFIHPIGSPVRLVRLDIATPDPVSLAADYASELGLELWAVADLAVATIGPHTIRLRPLREMAVPAVVVLGAHVDQPRSVEALGIEFDIEPVVFGNSPATAAGERRT